MDEITIGEVGRSLGRLEDSQKVQNRKLDDIKEQTTMTNGRVTTLERDVRDLKQHRLERVHHDPAKRASDQSDVITINIPASAISAKKISAFVVTVLAALFGAWKAGLF